MKLYRFVEYDIPDTDERGEKLVSVDEPLYRQATPDEIAARKGMPPTGPAMGSPLWMVRVNGADNE